MTEIFRSGRNYKTWYICVSEYARFEKIGRTNGSNQNWLLIGVKSVDIGLKLRVTVKLRINNMKTVATLTPLSNI